ncbi:sensor histidine kinase [Mobilicoccus pelagius]|uniref:histidine kinase n=1 Tax=Mobilicoccus pelagius NBRC 104925 TaxID=1089455 RepID=H5UT58_9MICO|nr:sensor histidine kinase [Mobilicoccus pelagius]GAB48916.1 putative two-component histidine kinase [Mobilicoccus pelagius NBRC 104925]
MDDDRVIPDADGPLTAARGYLRLGEPQDDVRGARSGGGATTRPPMPESEGVTSTTPPGQPRRTLARDLLDLTEHLGREARRLWSGPPPTLTDLLLVGTLLVAGVPFMTQSETAYADPVWGLVAFLCVILFSVPFLWRRTHPMAVALVLVLPHLVQLVLLDEPTAANVGVPVAVYSIARWSPDRRVRRAGLVLAGAGSLLAGMSWSASFNGDPAGGPGEYVLTVLVLATMCLAVTLPAWLFGALVRQRAEAAEETRQKALAVERSRVQNVRLAAQEERARIAREMHDVVAHSLSVIVVQSDGAAYALDSALERAREGEDPRVVTEALRTASDVLATIGRTARESLTDTRRLVGVLRQDDGEAEYAPTGGVDSLEELVGPLRDAGLEISTDVTGRRRPLSRATDLAVYRVVQESLTNVIKHAGEARVWVSLDYLPEALLLTIRDDGVGPGGVPDGQGHGLVGMRERLTAVGGRLWAGGAPGGGFLVEARIPYDAADPSRS